MKENKRMYISYGIRLCLVLLAAGTFNKSMSQTRPNVLLIMTDDQGFGDIGMSGNNIIQTPHLDRLSRQSVSYTNFYVSPVCAPTRASLLTGRYAQRTGVRSVTNGFETMHPEELTIAEIFSEVGYRTGIFGKWHLGEHYPSVPNGQGFQEFVGFRTGHFDDYFDPVLEHNGQPYPTRGYITDVLTDEAIRFMDESKEKPFFCYLPYNAPHTPLYVPVSYLKKYQNQGLNERTARVYAMIENIDDNMGRLLQHLQTTGLDKNTIVIFLSDNGPINGRTEQADWRFNAGLRDQKFTVYEGGIRTQCFMRWTNHFEAGKKIEKVAAHIDMLPTLLDLCNVPAPDSVLLDGRSLRSLLEAETAPWPDRTLFMHYSLKTLESQELYPGGIARTQRYKMVDGRELYDLQNDPGERENIAQQHADILAELDQAYRQWWQGILPQQGFNILPVPVGYLQEPLVRIAPHLGSVKGGLKYYGFRGLQGETIGEHPRGVDGDWITNWRSVDDQIRWEVEVVEPGNYDVALQFRVKEADAGAVVRVNIGSKQLDMKVPVADLEVAHWKNTRWGTVYLEAGNYSLSVQALQVPGETVMDLGAILFTKVL
ncbi:MAG: sulfatase-like hydrolase/transferase [Cyclobacteriaceae bacterium]